MNFGNIVSFCYSRHRPTSHQWDYKETSFLDWLIYDRTLQDLFICVSKLLQSLLNTGLDPQLIHNSQTPIPSKCVSWTGSTWNLHISSHSALFCFWRLFHHSCHFYPHRCCGSVVVLVWTTSHAHLWHQALPIRSAGPLGIAIHKTFSVICLGKFQLPSCCNSRQNTAIWIAKVTPKTVKGCWRSGERREFFFCNLMTYLHCVLLFAAYLL